MFSLRLFVLLSISSPYLNAGQTLNIVYTTDMEGSVTPCACAIDPGGGTVRRLNWYRGNAFSPENTIYINSGNTFFPSTPFLDYETKYLKYGAQIMAESMISIRIDAAIPGRVDFKMGIPFFLTTSKKLPLLITNSGSENFLKEVSIKRAGYNISILGVLSPKLLTKKLTEDLSIKDPIKTIKSRVKKLKKHSDIIILLADTDKKELDLILKKIRDIDIILSSHISEELRIPLLVKNTVVIRSLLGGDSIGCLKYQHKKGAKKLDIGKNNDLIAEAAKIDMLIALPTNKSMIKQLKANKENLEDMIVKKTDRYSRYDNRIDFLGKTFEKKNELSANVKKYGGLQNAITHHIKDDF